MGENLIHGFSGAISAMISTGLLHPFESIRTKMQSETSKVYFFEYIKKIFNEEGIKGIYSGFSSSLFNVSLSYSMYFFCYKVLKTRILKVKPKLGFLDDAYVSFVASLIVIFINTPLWTINTRLVKDRSKSFFQLVKQILNNEGISGFFKGTTMSIILTINPVIQYSLYEYLKTRFRASSVLQYFIIGALAKFIATVFTYPILTLRTRHQLNEKENVSIKGYLVGFFNQDFRSNFDQLLSLYNGFFSKAIQTMLNSAIILSMHEKITKMMCEYFLTKKTQIIIR